MNHFFSLLVRVSKLGDNPTASFVLTAISKHRLSVSATIEKEQYRSIIRFLSLSVKTYIRYGIHSPSHTAVYHWFADFRRCRTLVFHEPRPVGPNTATAEETVGKSVSRVGGSPNVLATTHSA